MKSYVGKSLCPRYLQWILRAVGELYSVYWFLGKMRDVLYMIIGVMFMLYDVYIDRTTSKGTPVSGAHYCVSNL